MRFRNRTISAKILRLMQYFPSIVLTGARQVGKSTLLKKLFHDSHEIITFDPVIDIDNARSNPELFFRNHPGALVLDEIQYAPELIPVLKRLIDENRTPGKYVLTGSQQWGVLKAISESLAGRAVILEMSGFNLDECADREPNAEAGSFPLSANNKAVSLPFTLNEHIYRGQLPEPQELPADLLQSYFNSYLATYIERDIRIMAEISDLQQFGRFYRLCGALSAQEVNYSQIGRDIGLTPQTAGRWLELLKAGYQWKEIPAYSGNTIKRVSGKPKGYLTDTGLLCSSLFLSGPQAVSSHPQWGSIFETLAANELFRKLQQSESMPAVYHWRSHSGAEVDIILERDGIFYPVEIKSAARPSKKDTRGISAFRETYPHLQIAKGIVIYPGETWFRLSDNDFAAGYFCI